MTRSDLVVALSHPNVQGFLALIREGETNQTQDAYRMMVGGSLFTAPPWEHPRQAIKAGNLPLSTAAGAYQYIRATWDEVAAKYGFEDFSPANQDLGAIALIVRAGALDLVKGGRVREAISRCSKTWASLPGSPYGQPTAKLERLLAAYTQAGGSVADESQTKEVKPMAPIVLPIILELAKNLLPQLGALGFGSGSEVAQRNVAAATIAADAIVKATNSVNLQEAAEKVQNDPEALTAARQAVSEVVLQIGEAGGGGIKGARDAAALGDGDWKKVVLSAPFLIALLMIPLIYAVVAAALLKVTWLAEMPNEVRAGVIGSVTGLILGSLVGFFYGTSASSQRKTELAAR